MSQVERDKTLETEAFFLDVEKKVPFGDILVSTFKGHTINRSWRLEGIEIYGKTQEGEDTPVMKLVNNSPYKMARLEVRAESFSGISFIAQPREIKLGEIDEKIEEGAFVFKLDSLPLDSQSRILFFNSEYGKWLINLLSEVISKISQGKE